MKFPLFQYQIGHENHPDKCFENQTWSIAFPRGRAIQSESDLQVKSVNNSPPGGEISPRHLVVTPPLNIHLIPETLFEDFFYLAVMAPLLPFPNLFPSAQIPKQR